MVRVALYYEYGAVLLYGGAGDVGEEGEPDLVERGHPPPLNAPALGHLTRARWIISCARLKSQRA